MKNKNLYILFLLSIVFSNAQKEITISERDSTIQWSSKYVLEWNDFLGEVNPDNFGMAFTSYKIDIYPSDVLVDEQGNIHEIEELTVKANFYKKQSWTTGSFDTNLLLHEQLHFDIAELYARKIRQRFEFFKKKGEANFDLFWKQYKELWIECRSFQAKYDSETNHGINFSKNQEWNKVIKMEMNKLSDYR